MDGRGITAALALGADGVQVGTAFLGCPESALGDVERAVLMSGRPTTITETMTGRPARAVRTRIVDELADAPALPFPLQAVATGQVTRAALERGREDLAFVLAGQGAARGRTLDASELVAELVEETERVLASLQS